MMKAKRTKKKKKSESCKYSEWEKERRNRLNVCFDQLDAALPDYDPTNNRKKCQIITLAVNHIKLLQEKNQMLIEKTDCTGLYANEISQLKGRLSELTLRCRQLASLLTALNVQLPAGLPADCLAMADFPKPTKWSNKLKPETINEVLKGLKKNKENKKKLDVKKVNDKDGNVIKGKVNGKQSKGVDQTSSNVSKVVDKKGVVRVPCTSEFPATRIASVVPLASVVGGSVVGDTAAAMPLRELNKAGVVSKAAAAGDDSGGGSKTNLVTMTTGSSLLAAPIMATGVQTLPVVVNRNASLQNLGPGTLILPDGRIVNVPPPTAPTFIAANTQFIVNRPANPPPPPAVIVISNSNVAQLVNGNTPVSTLAGVCKSVQQPARIMKPIVPKHKRELTKTTFANKVPLLALSAHHPRLVVSKLGISSNTSRQPGKQNRCTKKAKPTTLNRAKDVKPPPIDKTDPNPKILSTPSVVDEGSREISPLVVASEKNNQNLSDEMPNLINPKESVKAPVENCTNNSDESITNTDLASASNGTTKRPLDTTDLGENDGPCASKKAKLLPECSNRPTEPTKVNSEPESVHEKADKRDMSDCIDHSARTANSEKYSIEALFCGETNEAVAGLPSRTDFVDDKRQQSDVEISEGSSTSKSVTLKPPVSTSSVLTNCTESGTIVSDIDNVSLHTDHSQTDNKLDCNEKQSDTFGDVDHSHETLSKSAMSDKPVFNKDNGQQMSNSNDQLTVCDVSVSSRNVCAKVSENKAGSGSGSAKSDFSSYSIDTMRVVERSDPTGAMYTSSGTPHSSEIGDNNRCRPAPELIHSTSGGNPQEFSENCRMENTVLNQMHNNSSEIVSNICLPLDDITKVSNISQLNDTKEQMQPCKSNKNETSPSTDETKQTGSTGDYSITQQSLIENDKCVQMNMNSVLPSSSKHDKNDAFTSMTGLQTISSNCASDSFPTEPAKLSSNDCNTIPIDNKDKNGFLAANGHMGSCMDDVRLSIPNTEFSSDLFTSLQVPSGSHHPESLSPTAAFLLAFPLVSTSKTSEMLVDNDNSDSQHASPTILQIGTIESNEIYNQTAIPPLNPTMDNMYGDEKMKRLTTDTSKTTDSKSKLVQTVKQNNTLHEFHDNRYAIDHMYLPPTDTGYNNFNRSVLNYNETTNYAVGGKSKPAMLAPNRANSNKPRDKNVDHREVAQHKDCFATSSSANALHSGVTYLPSCDNDRRKQTNKSSTVNNQTAGDIYHFAHHDNKKVDNKSGQFVSPPNTNRNSTLVQHKGGTTFASTSTHSATGSSKNYNSTNNSGLDKKATDNAMLHCNFTHANTAAAPVSMHSYSSYNLFPNCTSNSDFSLSNPSNYVSKYQHVNASNEPKKSNNSSSSNSANIFSSSWSVANNTCYGTNSTPFTCNTITTYSTTYQNSSAVTAVHKNCSTQTQTSTKLLPNAGSVVQPNHSNSCLPGEMNAKAEKGGNSLPKFSTNFNFMSNHHQSSGHQELGYQPMASSELYKPDKMSGKKSTTAKVAIRPPVNWMTTPDLRPPLPDLPPSTLVPDMMFIGPQKDMDLTTPNVTNCNNLSQFNISNAQPFYGLDMPLDLPSQFGDSPAVSKSSHRASSATAVSSSQQYSWSPSKSSLPLLSHLDNHSLMLPSTLPTLVGDLALGTNTGPSTPATESSVRHYNIPPPSLSLNSVVSEHSDKSMRFNNNSKTVSHNKLPRQEHHSNVQNKSNKVDTPLADQGKDGCKACTVGETSVRENSICGTNASEYCGGSKAHQSTNTTGSFLSVSQLVDHVNKTEVCSGVPLTLSSRKVAKQPVVQHTKSASGGVAVQKRGNMAAQPSEPNKKSVTQQKLTGSTGGNRISSSGAKSYEEMTKHDQIVSNFIPSSVGSNQQSLINQWHCNNRNFSTPSSSSSYKCGSYSAESLIGVTHDTMANSDGVATFSAPASHQQYVHHQPHQQSMNPNTHTHAYGGHGHHQKPFVSSVSSTSGAPNIIHSDLHHSLTTNNIIGQQHMNELAANQNSLSHQQSMPSYQNCFNLPAPTTSQNSSGYPPPPPANHHAVGVPYLTDNTDYQVGCLDTSYLFGNQPTLTHSSAPNNLMFPPNIGSTKATSTATSTSAVSNSAANRSSHGHGQSASNNTINKLVTTSMSNSQTGHKSNRKRKEETASFPITTLTSASASLHSSQQSTVASSTAIYTTSYLHSSPHVSSSSSKAPSICESLPPAIPSVLNPASSYQPTASVASCTVPLSSAPAANCHPGTTTLTNFNLSTIFPEINDKRCSQGAGSGANHLTREFGKHGFDAGNGNWTIRNHPDYLPPLRTELHNVVPPQIGATASVNTPSLPPRFPADSFISSSSFCSGHQNQ